MGCDCMRARKGQGHVRSASMPEGKLQLMAGDAGGSQSVPVSPRAKKPRCLVMSLYPKAGLRVLKEPLSNKYQTLRELNDHEQLVQYIPTKQTCHLRVVSRDVKPRTRVVRDAKTMRKLDCPSLARVFEILEDSENYYVVSESIEHGRVDEYFRGMTIVNEKALATVMTQLLCAVTHCHSRNVIHQGLSINNVMLKIPPADGKIMIGVTGFDVLFPSGPDINAESIYRAPETAKGVRTKKADIWSCGVIMYYLLTKKLPIHPGKYSMMLCKGRYPVINFEEEELGYYSESAKSLLRSMLCCDPQLRPEAEECLQHEWILSNQPSKRELPKAFSRQDDVKSNPIKDAIKEFIIQRVLTPNDISDLAEMFRAYDDSGDGCLTSAELVSFLRRMVPEAKAVKRAACIMKIMDRDGNGQIDFSEFLLALYDEDKLLTKEHLMMVFRTIKKKGKTYISMSDLRETFYIEGQRGNEEKLWRQIAMTSGVADSDVLTFQVFTEFLGSFSPEASLAVSFS